MARNAETESERRSENRKTPPDCPAGLGISRDGELSLLEIAPDAVLTTDSRGRITHVNQRATELFRADAAELVGLPVEALIPRDRREPHGLHRERYSHDPKPRAMHTVADLEAIRLDDGSTFPVDVTLFPVVVDGESVVLATVRDLSTTADPVPTMPLDTGRFQHDFGPSSDVVIRTDAERRVTWVSLSIEAWLGIRPGDVLGQLIESLGEGAGESELIRLTRVATERRRTTHGRVLARNASSPDGTWAAVDVVPLVNSHRGVDGLAVSLRDTDALVRAELARKRSEEALRLAMENSPIGMAQATPDGRVFRLNRAMRTLAGDAADRLVGSHLSDLTRGVHAQAVMAALSTCVEGEADTGELELEIHRDSDRPAWVQLHLCLVRLPDGTADHILAQFVDLTDEREAKRRLAASERHYRLLAEHASEVVLQVDSNRRIAWASPSSSAVFGLDPDQMTGQPFEELIMWEDRREASRRAKRALDQGQPDRWQSRFETDPGPWRWMSVHAAPLPDSPASDVPAGNESGQSIVIGLRDIHEQVLAERSLAQSEQRFRLAMDGAPQGMALVGLHMKFIECNEAFQTLVGRDGPWLDEHDMADILHPEDRESDLEQRDLLLAGKLHRTIREQRLLTADGRTTWVLQSSSLLRDESGMPLYYVEQFVDVTENRASREQLDFQTRHDPLTRLANRHGFDEAVSHLFDGDQGDDRGHAVLFCDLDNFKTINDQFGHAVGDQVLAAAAARVQSGIRTEDTAARIGGDEFVILLRGVSEPAVATAVADQLRAAVSQPIRNLDNPALRVTMSIGVAISDPGSDPRTVLREADDALYRAKSTGRDRVVVSATITSRPG